MTRLIHKNCVQYANRHMNDGLYIRGARSCALSLCIYALENHVDLAVWQRRRHRYRRATESGVTTVQSATNCKVICGSLHNRNNNNNHIERWWILKENETMPNFALSYWVSPVRVPSKNRTHFIHITPKKMLTDFPQTEIVYTQAHKVHRNGHIYGRWTMFPIHIQHLRFSFNLQHFKRKFLKQTRRTQNERKKKEKTAFN